MPDIEIKGMREALDKLDRATSDAVISRIMWAGVVHIEGKVKPYPPSSAANSPKAWTSGGNNRWYERGYGSKWVRKDGSVRGRQSSEMHGRSWTVRVRRHMGVVGNDTTYGRYLQDEAKQARFHRARNWKTIQDVVEEERDTVVGFAKREIDRELNR